MALSLSNFLYAIAVFLFTLAHAETRHYDFNVGWVTRNPDGQYPRPVIGINGEWPIPRIEANVGDRVVVQMTNSLGNESTSIHFHGLFMNGTTHMDGVGSTSQCPVPPGSTFTYNFTIDQPGTYWYHSHIDGQYPDGFRGPLIIHDPENPYADQFDQELVLTLSDWYHDQMPTLISSFISVTNPTGAEPVPESALMNDTQNLQINVEPGKTYFLRIVNMAAFAAQYFWVEGHTFRIVEVDGVYHEPAEADMLYITAAQRYSVLLTTKNATSENFAIVGSMDQDLFDVVPATLNPNVTSYLVYDKSAALPKPAIVDSFDAVYDDMNLVPYDHEPLLPDPDMSVELVVQMNNLGDGANYAFFNDITYVRQKVPTLYTVLSLPSTSSNGTATTDLLFDPTIYGQTNTHILPHNATIEIILNNHDPGKHPFHLHGHNFQSIARGAENSNDFNPANTTFPTFPMRRDTLLVRPNGHIVMRFKADNPGVWLFHCHIEWHVDSGLVMTFVEAPEMVREQLQGKIPEDHYAACQAGGMAHTGNAAGNTEDYLDLEGANVSIAPLPAGFTARGIVALVFSCVCGILGIVVVAWYGLGEMGSVELGMEEREIEKLKRELGGSVTGVVTVGSEGK